MYQFLIIVISLKHLRVDTVKNCQHMCLNVMKLVISFENYLHYAIKKWTSVHPLFNTDFTFANP